MALYIFRRLAFFLGALVASSVAIFLLIRAAGGNVAAIVLGRDASPDAIDALATEYGLDRPLAVQYLDWIGGMLSGDLGRSFRTNESVTDLVTSRLEVSIPLALMGLTLGLLIAIPAGIFAARNAGRPSGAFVGLLSQVGIAVPVFWAGILLSLLFGVHLGWLPTGGWTPWSVDPVQALRSLVLPVLSLGTILGAVMTRYVRSAVLDVMNQDYVRTARASGMTASQALLQVGLRNAALPIVTVIGLQMAELIGGTVIIEMVFSLPGLARMILANVAAREVIVVQSTVMLIIVFVIFVNFLIDMAYALLDPRTRRGR
ncbi:Putative oligopeptide ABC transport system membrane protein [Oceanicola granulosus HTCC2516]|uniref:Putative oligopeptide ABC transport system membrane protein n=1 Tax=Oceanicola granulosus (strain ATCC BAA-861 / DSM 15982 / KCTC 12143 / HTCC2516) TaxID=314256 RepID=Q2CJ58_OCEGH|nr:ABC transporter permease [Oceanicola granulosus]EAR52742.1 Putative oligopeptide ABC transport system membrane protein [Oceanicola granulosus HTCC2516]